MTLDPRELMSMPQDDLPDPQILPPKHFYGQILGYRQDVSPFDKTGNTQAIFYRVQLTEPAEDVTEEEVEAIKASGVELSAYQLRDVAYEITPSTMNSKGPIKRLHASMKLPGSNSTEQNMVESVGKRVLVELTVREYNGQMYNNITRMVGTGD